MRSGRLPKLTPEIRKKVCEAIVGGNTRDDAARYAGINPATFYRWMKRGRQAGRGAMCDFCKAVKKAENDCVVRNVAIIGKAAQKTWTAAAWWLERRRPDDWARKDTTKVVGAGKGGEVVIAVLGPGLSAEDL